MTAWNKERLLICTIILVILFTGTLAFIYPPSLYPDTAWGFQVLRSMQHGAAFNHLLLPDVDHINKTASSFLAWWSPGQYMVPFIFMWMFSLNIGQAVAITVTLCMLTGLAGLYFFYIKSGFSKQVSLFSIAFIACQQACVIPYIFYNGGEILLFAFAGWFLYGCVCFSKPGWHMALFILLSGLIGFFCKSSFLWIFITGVFSMWLVHLRDKNWKQVFTTSCYTGLPVIVALAIIYWGYLLKGINPASSSAGLKFSLQAFTFPLSSPVLNTFSVDDITGGLLYHIGPAPFNNWVTQALLMVMAALSVLLIIRINQTRLFTSYRILLTSFYGIAVLFFLFSYLRQADISFEARHIRIISLLVTPGLVHLVSVQKSNWHKYVLGFIWLLIATSSLQYLVEGLHRNGKLAIHGKAGISYLFTDRPMLNKIHQLDARQNNAIFVFTGPDLGLEIQYNRIISFNQINDNLEVENISTYYGHAGPLYIVLPNAYSGKKAEVYLKCFPGYKSFKIIQPPGSKYLIFAGQ